MATKIQKHLLESHIVKYNDKCCTLNVTKRIYHYYLCSEVLNTGTPPYLAALLTGVTQLHRHHRKLHSECSCTFIGRRSMKTFSIHGPTM